MTDFEILTQIDKNRFIVKDVRPCMGGIVCVSKDTLKEICNLGYNVLSEATDVSVFTTPDNLFNSNGVTVETLLAGICVDISNDTQYTTLNNWFDKLHEVSDVNKVVLEDDLILDCYNYNSDSDDIIESCEHLYLADGKEIPYVFIDDVTVAFKDIYKVLKRLKYDVLKLTPAGLVKRNTLYGEKGTPESVCDYLLEHTLKPVVTFIGMEHRCVKKQMLESDNIMDTWNSLKNRYCIDLTEFSDRIEIKAFTMW